MTRSYRVNCIRIVYLPLIRSFIISPLVSFGAPTSYEYTDAPTNTSLHLGVAEVERTASELEVRAAYRRMAKKYHPDGKGKLMIAETGAAGDGLLEYWNTSEGENV